MKSLVWVKRNVYKQPYRRDNGKPANHYFLKTHCHICKKEMFQCIANSKRGYKPSCSKACHYNFKKRLSSIKRPRPNGEYHIFVPRPNHPAANRHGYVYEHRLKAEEMLGRFLNTSERVHHINMVKHDNRCQNLFVFKNVQEHFKAHGSLNRIVADLIKDRIIKFSKKDKIYERVK